MSNELIIRQGQSKEEFEALYDLRWRLLRKPWNQPKGSEKDEKEEESYSFIAILNGAIIGTARLHKNIQKEGQIRYLAVEEKYQKMSIGKNLMSNIEKFAIRIGLESIILNARKTVSNFFKKLDYKIIGEGPLLFNEIEHYIMSKMLTPTN